MFLNYMGLSDDFANMWGAAAKYFYEKTDIDNLLGYEIINEPFGVSPHNYVIDSIIPGRVNSKYMYPFYKKVADRIWANHPDTLVFYEPIFHDLFSGGFSNNLGSPQNEVFSYHVYCLVVNPFGEPYSRYLCDALDTFFMSGKEKNVKKMKVGGFITEFGAVSDSDKSVKELDYILTKADYYLRSWAYW